MVFGLAPSYTAGMRCVKATCLFGGPLHGGRSVGQFNTHAAGGASDHAAGMLFVASVEVGSLQLHDVAELLGRDLAYGAEDGYPS